MPVKYLFKRASPVKTDRSSLPFSMRQMRLSSMICSSKARTRPLRRLSRICVDDMPSFFFVRVSNSGRGNRISATKPLPFVSGTRLINPSSALATTVVTRDTSSRLSMRGEPIKNLTECSPDGKTL